MKRLKGIYQNCNPIDQPEGFYRDALNINIEESVGAVTNEKGTENISSIGNGYDVIGKCLLHDGNIVLFCTHATDTDKILLFDGENTSTVIQRDFEFSPDYSIQAVPYINKFDENVVFWVDGKNNARFINIDDPDKSSTTHYNLFPSTDKIPKISLDRINSTGGSLTEGAYYFSIAYIHKDDSITDFYDTFGPVYIQTPSNTLSASQTSKSISLSFDNIDKDEYERIQIAVIPKIEGVFDEVQLLPEMSSESETFTYTGNESHRPGALEEVQIDKAFYEVPKTIAYQDDNLYLGNLKDKKRIDFQQYANDITVEAVTETLEDAQIPSWRPNSRDVYKDPFTASTKKGFRRGEVYAFYISLLLKNGGETRAFHIPGREPVQIDGDVAEGHIQLLGDKTNVASGKAPETRGFTVMRSPREDGVITIIYDDDELEIPLAQGQSKEQVANTIQSSVNSSTFTFTCEVEEDSFKFIHDNESSQNNGDNVRIRVSRDVSGQETRFSDQVFVEGTQGEHEQVSPTIFNRSYDIFSGGLDAESFEVDLSIETNVLEESWSIPVSSDTLVQDVVVEIVDFLNDQTEFSDHYLAEPNAPNSKRINIIAQNDPAQTTSEDYNGALKFDVRQTGMTSRTVDLTGGISGKDERSTYEDPNLPNIGPKKEFQFKSTPKINNMGYWENENETYPNNTDEWGSLAGEPVRHHHMPDITHEPFITETEEDNVYDYHVLGIKLSNITIPTELQDEVIGYKVYYANRTEENKRILDTVVPIRSREEEGVYKPEAINGGTYADGVVYTHPFTYLRKRLGVGDISHIGLYGSVSSTESDNFLQDSSRYPNKTYNLFDNDGGELNKEIENIQVNAAAYVETEEEREVGSNLTSFGFQKNMNNFSGESKLVLQLSREGQDLIPSNQHKIGNLRSFKTDLYNSFDLQQLASTGYIHTDMNNLDSDIILGGDTFITEYGYRTTREDGLDSDNYVVANRIITIESSDNINYRNSGENPWERVFPQEVNARDYSFTKFRATGEPVSDEEDLLYFDNYIGYQEEFSDVNLIKFPEINPKFKEESENYQTRVIRNSRGIRTFLQDDYVDLSKKRGELIKLSVYNNILIPHLERSLVRTKGREEIEVGDLRAFLGSGDIFSNKPDELIYSEDGFGGIQDIDSSISTPIGYFFYDKQARRLYLLNNDGVSDISEPILPIVRSMDDIRFGYNPYYERLVVCSNNGTYSYSPKIQGWVSRHSYEPNIILNDIENMYSIEDSSLWRHNTGDRGRFYGQVYNSEYEYIDNIEPHLSKLITTLNISSDVYNTDNKLERKSTFDKFRITNSYQDTGIVDVEYFSPDVVNYPDNMYIGNARNTNKIWHINKFRDIANIPDDIDPDLEWTFKRRLEDKYHNVTLIKDNSSNNSIFLYGSYLNQKQSIR